jgi:hypothetical protein
MFVLAASEMGSQVGSSVSNWTVISAMCGKNVGSVADM